jgi:hypothetical protein
VKSIDRQILKTVFDLKGIQVTFQSDYFNAIVPGLKSKDLPKFNMDICKAIDNYIENELKESLSDYNRSVVLYETKEVNNNMMFTW